MSRNNETIEKLWQVPVNDRCAMLACSLVEKNSGAVAAVRNLIRVATAMTRWLSVEQRFQLAETFRDAADTIERQDAARAEIS